MDDYRAVNADYRAVNADYRAVNADYRAVIPDFYPVIPAKAGIQRVGDADCASPPRFRISTAASANVNAP